ncbi:hypothetical protein CLAFUW4_03175 [Fulvia fulva]|uniref:DUF952 domain-containing protein n=1 Tax=Passalora fulva TaxID=5499 RepID=A0A9Q8P5H6_PASFU|nr:uncharacterized protein CLAFUR5_03159 [Fulvia fulva]KAK4631552.1 hypothetical protein CLAFUR4_03164 [Fulvia fulva]KAK4633171.1 hypothetical protein CLAFUR0_03168 [Fulvia fulva]UJO13772.1 hypothetical protein CLAFUR5_03159 [Fulvia fulva]WPV10574.1 hypothetical protein CLAFUW4_03175 [Fulvia fulva]WPV26814.1 hypothetical protein CLAFUW7_03168 [Fulvia fulva]
MTSHNHFYKILDNAPREPLPETLPLSELDKKDGFIHLSTANQIKETANLFFSKTEKLWLLKLRVETLKKDGNIEWNSDIPGCPHLHDSQQGLGKSNVEAIIVAEKGNHGSWKEVPELLNLED